MSGSFFFGMEALMCNRTARERERLSHTLHRLCEARQADAMQDIGGGSSPAPARTPRRSPATARAKKSDSGDDGDGEPPARRGVQPLLLDLEDVAATVALSTRGVQRLVQEGNFPKPRAVSARRVAWRVSDVEAWVAALPVADMLPPPSGA